MKSELFAARPAGHLGSAGALFLLRLIVMPLDGEVHARTQHDNLERKKDYREEIYPIPIHHWSISSLLSDAFCRGSAIAKLLLQQRHLTLSGRVFLTQPAPIRFIRSS
ncbi:hypothetical protein ACIK7D_11025 [Agrobacterium sp. P15N1-A]